LVKSSLVIKSLVVSHPLSTDTRLDVLIHPTPQVVLGLESTFPIIPSVQLEAFEVTHHGLFTVSYLVRGVLLDFGL
jgi:hypothetical protein